MENREPHRWMSSLWHSEGTKSDMNLTSPFLIAPNSTSRLCETWFGQDRSNLHWICNAPAIREGKIKKQARNRAHGNWGDLQSSLAKAEKIFRETSRTVCDGRF